MKAVARVAAVALVSVPGPRPVDGQAQNPKPACCESCMGGLRLGLFVCFCVPTSARPAEHALNPHINA